MADRSGPRHGAEAARSEPGSPARAAVVTGGASGIGAALVDRLHGAGLAVAVLDLAPAPAADLALAVDVSEQAAVLAAVETVEAQLGPIGGVFLNAGLATGLDTGLEQVCLQRYRRLLGANVDGVVFGLQAALPALRRAGGGSVVATASLAGLVPLPDDPVYTLTKHAVVGLIRAVAAQVAGEGITVAAVCPGFTDTPLLDPLAERLRTAGFPLLTAAEVAEAALRAASGPSGACWVVQPGREAVPYRFRGVPGARTDGGEAAVVPL